MELSSLGLGVPLMVSATTKRGKFDLLDAIGDALPAETGDKPAETEMKTSSDHCAGGLIWLNW